MREPPLSCIAVDAMATGITRRGLIKIAAALSVSGTTVTARADRPRVELRNGRAGGRRRSSHFVLVHGAWHGAWCWYKVVAALERGGQRVTAIDLPGSGIDSTPANTVTRQAQVDRVLEAIDAAREPVILVGHSAGGPVVSEVAEARPERIEKLVYLSAFLVPSGVSPIEIAIGDRGSHLTANLIFHPELGTFEVRAGARREAFYNECDDQDVALANLLLKPYSLQALAPPMQLGAGFDRVRRFYVRCGRDQAISPSVQDGMIAALPCERVIPLAESDHSPFFSHPRELLGALLQIARA